MLNNLLDSNLTIEEEFLSYLINHRKNESLITLKKLGANLKDVPLLLLEKEEANKATGIIENETTPFSLQWQAACALTPRFASQAAELATKRPYTDVIQDSKKWKKNILDKKREKILFPFQTSLQNQLFFYFKDSLSAASVF